MKMSSKIVGEYGSVKDMVSGVPKGSSSTSKETAFVSGVDGKGNGATGGELVLHQGESNNETATGGSTALVARKDIDGGLLALSKRAPPKVPKPTWHAPWKLKSVVSGHLGWVRCLAFEPGNQWFVTGATGIITPLSPHYYCLICCLFE